MPPAVAGPSGCARRSGGRATSPVGGGFVIEAFDPVEQRAGRVLRSSASGLGMPDGLDGEP